MKHHVMSFDSTITKWDESIPLGNGAIGALIYGPSNALRFSLDLNGLWDCSTPSVAGGEYTYANLKRLAEERKNEDIIRIFDKPYDNATPTKLPAGKLILDLGVDENVASSLNLYSAEAVFTAGRVTVRAFIDANEEVGVCSVDSDRVGFSWEAPAYGKRNADTLAIEKSLADLDYESSADYVLTENGRTYGGFTQRVNEGLTYGLIAGMTVSDGKTLIAYTVVSNIGRDEVICAARELIDSALDKGYDNALRLHKEWWAEYWEKGYISVPDEFFSFNYMLGNYLLASCSRKGRPPMPLQGVWTADNGNLPPWKGDYHHDLNTQLSYISYLKGNHLPEGESFVDFLLSFEKEAESFALDYYGVKGGLCLPAVMDIEGNPLGGWAMYSLSPTNMAWLCKTLIDQYYYTDDKGYLKDRAYPYIKKYGLLLRGLLSPNSEGKLVLPVSSSPEIHDNNFEAFLTPNSNYDLSLIIYTFTELSSLADILGYQEDKALWDGLLGKMDALHVDSDNVLMLSRDERLKESHRHHSHMMPIHPLRQLRYEREEDREIIDATVRDLEELGPYAYTGFSYPWRAEFYAIQGNGKKAYDTLKLFWSNYCLPNGFHCNGDYRNELGLQFTYRPFTLEANMCAIDALQEMMLYDGEGKTVIAPAIPTEWRDYSFKLRSINGFVIDVSVKGGELYSLTVEAYRDTCTDLYFGDERIAVINIKKDEFFQM